MHKSIMIVVLLAGAARAEDTVAWKPGDLGVTLRDTSVMSGKTRLGTVAAGTELTVDKVQGKWISVETRIPGGASTTRGWIAADSVGHIPADVPDVFPAEMHGAWSAESRHSETGRERLLVRSRYLLWIRDPAADVHFIPATALTDVTRSGVAGTGWKFHSAQFVVPSTIGMPLPFPAARGSQDVKPVIANRSASVKQGEQEVILTLGAAEATVRGIAPGIPYGASITIVDHVTDARGEREAVYRIEVPQEELRFRQVPADEVMMKK